MLKEQIEADWEIGNSPGYFLGWVREKCGV